MRAIYTYAYFFGFLYFTFGLHHVAAARPLARTLSDDPVLTNSLTAYDTNRHFLNTSSLGDVDPDFDIMPHFKGKRLFPVSCLLDAMDAALQLALGDFEGTVTKTMVFILNDYPQVQIQVLPYTDQGRSLLPWKYAVWALNYSINTMIKNGNYQSSVFIILRKGHGVGGLSYTLTQPSISEPQSMTMENLVDGNDSIISSFNKSSLRSNLNSARHLNSTVDVAYRSSLLLEFELTDTKVTLNDIFITSFDILRAFAAFPRSGRIVADVTHIRTGNLYLAYRDPNDPPRTQVNPPYFENEWLLRALALAPGYMVQRQLFREVNIRITVDHFQVGEISLSRKKPTLGLATA